MYSWLDDTTFLKKLEALTRANSLIAIFVLEIDTRNSVSRKKERIRITNWDWTDIDPSYATENKQKSPAAEK